MRGLAAEAVAEVGPPMTDHLAEARRLARRSRGGDVGRTLDLAQAIEHLAAAIERPSEICSKPETPQVKDGADQVAAQALTDFWLNTPHPAVGRIDEAKAVRAGLRAAGYAIVPIPTEVERDPGTYQGRHRAIRQHVFVQHRGDDRNGCGRPEPDEPHVRCGYYRMHHPTMAGDS